MSALTLFCDILKTEMGLDDDQVYLYNQKFDIPTDDRLYIAVGILTVKPFGNTQEFTTDVDGALNELLSVNMHGMLSVNIMSRGPDARDRKEEVILALKSVYSQQQQEANGFYVSPHTSNFVNLSELDGAAIPYRFNISVVIQYKVIKTKVVPYYDNFPTPTVTVEP